MNKHGICSKCNIILNQNNYRTGRAVRKFCYNNHVLAFYKIKISSSFSPKSDVGTQTDFSDKQDSSKKQSSSRKQVSTRKQDRSGIQDGSNKDDSSNKQDVSISYPDRCLS